MKLGIDDGMERKGQKPVVERGHRTHPKDLREGIKGRTFAHLESNIINQPTLRLLNNPKPKTLNQLSPPAPTNSVNMHAFKTIFTIAASVAMVAAMPTNEKPNPDAQDKCNNNQVAACCDPSDFILGLNCVGESSRSRAKQLPDCR